MVTISVIMVLIASSSWLQYLSDAIIEILLPPLLLVWPYTLPVEFCVLALRFIDLKSLGSVQFLTLLLLHFTKAFFFLPVHCSYILSRYLIWLRIFKPCPFLHVVPPIYFLFKILSAISVVSLLSMLMRISFSVPSWDLLQVCLNRCTCRILCVSSEEDGR